MRRKPATSTSGLFLLFAAVLMLMSPVQASLNPSMTLRPVAEHKEEHRESKLRTCPPEVEHGRRTHEKRNSKRCERPSVSQRDVVTSGEHATPRVVAERSTVQRRQNYVKKRHAPPLLQVFRR